MTMQFAIKNRFTGGVQVTAEIECDEIVSYSVKLGLAVKWAVKARAYLAGASLAGASLARVDLADANLTGADFAGADLTGAYLAGADLTGAYLAGASLAGASLAGANLTGADLADANLTGADLADANLARADLEGADLADANLTGANLTRAYQVSDRIIDGGLRSDGYRFLLTRTEPGDFRIKAGCRNFTVAEAAAHWDATRPAGDPLGDETRLIIKHMLAIAEMRKWVPLAAEPDEERAFITPKN